MFWLGLVASIGIGGVLGLWFLTLVDGVRCRLEGIPDARELKLVPAFERTEHWSHLPWERLRGGVHGVGFARAAVLVGALVWGITWTAFWFRSGSVLEWLWNTAFFSGLFFVALLDARWRILPVEPMVGAGLIFGIVRIVALGGSVFSFLLGALAMAVFFGVQSYASRGRWLGSGDPVLAVAIGMALGWPLAPVAIYATYLAVIPLLLIQYARVRTFRRVRWPFGPLLAFGALVSWLYGMPIWMFLAGT